MDDFDNIKQNWKEQPIPKPSKASFKSVKGRIGRVARKQKIANVVLLSTVVVLVVFFFYIKAMEHQDVALALGAMIVVLLVRVLVEFFSLRTLKNLSMTLDIESFKARLIGYYRGRVGVHTVLTPLLILVYCFAFWTLLPDFKESLSKGFYNYIIVSSLVLLVVLGGFIFVQVRKEMGTLKELRNP